MSYFSEELMKEATSLLKTINTMVKDFHRGDIYIKTEIAEPGSTTRRAVYIEKSK